MDNLIIFDPTKLNIIKYDVTHKYFMDVLIPYNTLSEIPLHKIWIQIDKSKILHVIDNNIILGLTISNTSINTIKIIENKMLETINKNYNIDGKLNSNLIEFKTSNKIPTFQILTDSNTLLFNNNDEQIITEKLLINDLHVGNEINVITELSNINVNISSRIINIFWKAVQIKKIDMININKSLFAKPKYVPPPMQNTQMYNSNLPPHLPQHIHTEPILNKQHSEHSELSMSQSQPRENPVIKPKFMPSLSDLTNALKKLKPVESGQTAPQQQTTAQIEIPKNVQLKHVVTKEPINFVDIMKQEHKENQNIMMINDMQKIMKINKYIKNIGKKNKNKYDSLTKNI